ncbi:dynein light chain Tctex-type 5-like [Anopheles maculipalpis]|uniref:dynein light chain Tctex-type 5-like n=1 Tax=Anopheles maculipalpis TaxID=1496333 RepID=UPI0021590D7A|nr:dynein light chain Tctex-type 5-like [Anopheles maculipalpis]
MKSGKETKEGEKGKRPRKIGFVDPQEGSEGPDGRKSTEKTYRKSTYPRESMAAMARKSSVLILSRLMGPAMTSSRADRGLYDRTSMYVVPRFQNTYRLDSKNPFRREAMLTLMDRFLKSYLEEYKYVPKRAKWLAENLSEELRNQFKLCQFERYRIVALVTVGDKKMQDFRCVARALWDAEKDDCLSCTYEALTFFVVASVWVVYFE